MAKRKYNKAYKEALARASARTILEKLGVTHFPKFDATEPFTEREPETIITTPKRFRRTKREMQELKAFTDWQLERRLLKANTALNNGGLETFAANA